MAGTVTTMISVDFPNGAIISLDRVRRQLIATLTNGSVMTLGGYLPARPNPPSVFRVEGVNGEVEEVVKEEVLLAPISSTTSCHKLGYKKAPILGTDIWNKRFLRLEPSALSYHENDSSGAKGVIVLNSGCTVRVIQAHEPARKDRYEDGHNPGVGALMTMNIGSMMNQYSTPIGKPNCVELHCPPNVGNMLDTVMGGNAMSLAFGGGMNHIKKQNARTYYFSFDTLAAAEDFASKLENNVKCLQQNSNINNSNNGVGAVRGANGVPSGASINNIMNMAHSMQANQKLAASSETSLEYYRNILGQDIPIDVLYERLILFYDQLAAVNIVSPYH